MIDTANEEPTKMNKEIENRLVAALYVMVLNDKIRQFLLENDPKAFEQAVNALKDASEFNEKAKTRILNLVG